jgi:putative ABC transport system permease protein
MIGDLQYSVRSFLRTPGFTAIVVGTLALGIGANTAIFTVVNAVLLKPLPYSDAGELMRVRGGSSYPDLREWTRETASFDGIGAFRPQTFDYVPASAGAEAERVPGALVTGGLLGMLGAFPLSGRLLGPDDDRAGAAAVALVSEEFWRTRLGSDPAVLGRALGFNGQTYTIVGVLDARFTLPGTAAHVMAPFYPQARREGDARGAHTLRAIVRLKRSVPLSQAQQEMDALAVRLEQQFPHSNRDVRFVLIPLNESLTGQIRGPLVMLLATVGFVLLIACVNVANLLIARGAARSRELAVRAALGAGRWRIARQLLTESVLLAATGGALAIAVAWWITKAVVGLAPAGVPRLDQAGLDLGVLAFTAAVSMGTGLLFGLLPAVTTAWASLADASRGGTRATSGGNRARAALMVAEIALALVLVVGAGLLLRSFSRVVQQPIGFDTRNLTTANITFSAQRYFDIPSRVRVFEAFEEGIRAIPGVRGVAFTTDLPIAGAEIYHNLAFEGRTFAPGGEPEVYYRGVSPAYFDTLGIRLTRGRGFTDDDRTTAPAVAIVNESFVREYYPTEDPIGRRIRWVSGAGDWITIVGVAADVRGLSLESGEVPAVHIPIRQERAGFRMWMDVAVRTDGPAAALVPAMRRELARLDPTVPLTRPATMDAVIAASIADRRFNLYLLGGFALLSLLLAAAGAYGVMSYAVQQRTREMGVRLALGATPGSLLRLIVGRGVGLAALGVAIGTAGAAVLSRTMSGFLFQIAPTDLTTFLVSALVLLAAAALATWLPARRAARVDPLTALRSE